MSSATVLRALPQPVLNFGPCPGWCIGHTDEPIGRRRHTGIERSVLGRAPNGQPVHVRLRSELHDDGDSTCDVYVIEAAGVIVELALPQMYSLLQATERVFWHLDDSGQMYAGNLSSRLEPGDACL